MSSRKVEIMCPRCSWRPGPQSRWVCRPACGHSWNTFDTGGICPACGLAWQQTSCPSCGRWSPHADWYRETAGGDASQDVNIGRRGDEKVLVPVRLRRG
jgi:predicted amidophosphoribosyltransferase